jgi:hypothetical protein
MSLYSRIKGFFELFNYARAHDYSAREAAKLAYHFRFKKDR